MFHGEEGNLNISLNGGKRVLNSSGLSCQSFGDPVPVAALKARPALVIRPQAAAQCKLYEAPQNRNSSDDAPAEFLTDQ